MRSTERLQALLHAYFNSCLPTSRNAILHKLVRQMKIAIFFAEAKQTRYRALKINALSIATTGPGQEANCER